MATPKYITGKVTNPDGTAAALAKITVTLSQQTMISGTQEIAPAVINATAAADGTYTFQAYATNDMTPNGTFMTFIGSTAAGGWWTATIQVPQGVDSGGHAGTVGDPFHLTLLTTSTPTASPSPNHVSTLTVDGLSTLSGSIVEGKDFQHSAQTVTEAVLVSGVDATAGELIDVTLTANRVVGLPLNPAVGQDLVLLVTMGGTGGYKLTYPAGIKTAWQPASAVGDVSALQLRYFGTNWQQIGGQTAVSQLGVLAHRGPAVVGSLTVRDPATSGPYTNLLADGVTATPSGVSFAQMYDNGGEVYNVKAFGVTGNAKQAGDGAMNGVDGVLTSATVGFAAGDVGKPIFVLGAGVAGAVLNTTIASFQSSTQVTLTAVSSTLVAAMSFVYGTDDAASIRLAQAAIPTLGGIPYFPPARYYVGSSLTGITNRGTSVWGANAAAATLYFAGSGDFFRISHTADSSAIVAGSLRGLTLDGSGAAAGAVAVHIGDLNSFLFDDVTIQHFNGVGSVGRWFDNTVVWTESVVDFKFSSNDNTTHNKYTVNGGTNSFGYHEYVNAKYGIAAGQIGFDVQSGNLYNGRFDVHGNVNGGVGNTAIVWKVAAGSVVSGAGNQRWEQTTGTLATFRSVASTGAWKVAGNMQTDTLVDSMATLTIDAPQNTYDVAVLGSNKTLTHNTSTVVFSTGSLAVGVWLIVINMAVLTPASASKLEFHMAAGTATASFNGGRATEVNGAAGVAQYKSVVISTIVKISATGTVSVSCTNNDVTLDGTAFATTDGTAGFVNASGSVAVRLA